MPDPTIASPELAELAREFQRKRRERQASEAETEGFFRRWSDDVRPPAGRRGDGDVAPRPALPPMLPDFAMATPLDAPRPELGVDPAAAAEKLFRDTAPPPMLPEEVLEARREARRAAGESRRSQPSQMSAPSGPIREIPQAPPDVRERLRARRIARLLEVMGPGAAPEGAVSPEELELLRRVVATNRPDSDLSTFLRERLGDRVTGLSPDAASAERARSPQPVILESRPPMERLYPGIPPDERRTPRPLLEDAKEFASLFTPRSMLEGLSHTMQRTGEPTAAGSRYLLGKAGVGEEKSLEQIGDDIRRHGLTEAELIFLHPLSIFGAGQVARATNSATVGLASLLGAHGGARAGQAADEALGGEGLAGGLLGGIVGGGGGVAAGLRGAAAAKTAMLRGGQQWARHRNGMLRQVDDHLDEIIGKVADPEHKAFWEAARERWRGMSGKEQQAQLDRWREAYLKQRVHEEATTIPDPRRMLPAEGDVAPPPEPPPEPAGPALPGGRREIPGPIRETPELRRAWQGAHDEYRKAVAAGQPDRAARFDEALRAIEDQVKGLPPRAPGRQIPAPSRFTQTPEGLAESPATTRSIPAVPPGDIGHAMRALFPRAGEGLGQRPAAPTEGRAPTGSGPQVAPEDLARLRSERAQARGETPRESVEQAVARWKREGVPEHLLGDLEAMEREARQIEATSASIGRRDPLLDRRVQEIRGNQRRMLEGVQQRAARDSETLEAMTREQAEEVLANPAGKSKEAVERAKQVLAGEAEPAPRATPERPPAAPVAPEAPPAAPREEPAAAPTQPEPAPRPAPAEQPPPTPPAEAPPPSVPAEGELPPNTGNPRWDAVRRGLAAARAGAQAEVPKDLSPNGKLSAAYLVGYRKGRGMMVNAAESRLFDAATAKPPEEPPPAAEPAPTTPPKPEEGGGTSRPPVEPAPAEPTAPPQRPAPAIEEPPPAAPAKPAPEPTPATEEAAPAPTEPAPPAEPASQGAPPISKRQLASLQIARKRAGLDEEGYRAILREKFGVEHFRDLTTDRFEDALGTMKSAARPREAEAPAAPTAPETTSPGPAPSRAAAGEVSPLKQAEPPEENYRVDLSTYTDRLFHETDFDGATRVALANAQSPAQDIWFSNSPDLATGQRVRGVILEFDAQGIEGQVNKGKPAADLSWREAGTGEFLSKYQSPGSLRSNLRSVTVLPDADGSRGHRVALLRTLREQGWTETKLAGGGVRFVRSDAPTKAGEAASPTEPEPATSTPAAEPAEGATPTRPAEVPPAPQEGAKKGGDQPAPPATEPAKAATEESAPPKPAPEQSSRAKAASEAANAKEEELRKVSDELFRRKQSAEERLAKLTGERAEKAGAKRLKGGRFSRSKANERRVQKAREWARSEMEEEFRDVEVLGQRVAAAREALQEARRDAWLAKLDDAEVEKGELFFRDDAFGEGSGRSPLENEVVRFESVDREAGQVRVTVGTWKDGKFVAGHESTVDPDVFYGERSDWHRGVEAATKKHEEVVELRKAREKRESKRKALESKGTYGASPEDLAATKPGSKTLAELRAEDHGPWARTPGGEVGSFASVRYALRGDELLVTDAGKLAWGDKAWVAKAGGAVYFTDGRVALRGTAPKGRKVEKMPDEPAKKLREFLSEKGTPAEVLGVLGSGDIFQAILRDKGGRLLALNAAYAKEALRRAPAGRWEFILDGRAARLSDDDGPVAIVMGMGAEGNAPKGALPEGKDSYFWKALKLDRPKKLDPPLGKLKAPKAPPKPKLEKKSFPKEKPSTFTELVPAEEGEWILRPPREVVALDEENLIAAAESGSALPKGAVEEAKQVKALFRGMATEIPDFKNNPVLVVAEEGATWTKEIEDLTRTLTSMQGTLETAHRGLRHAEEANARDPGSTGTRGVAYWKSEVEKATKQVADAQAELDKAVDGAESDTALWLKWEHGNTTVRVALDKAMPAGIGEALRPGDQVRISRLWFETPKQFAKKTGQTVPALEAGSALRKVKPTKKGYTLGSGLGGIGDPLERRRWKKLAERVHKIGREIEMSPEARRFIYKAVTGKDTLKEMGVDEVKAVLEHMKLQALLSSKQGEVARDFANIRKAAQKMTDREYRENIETLARALEDQEPPDWLPPDPVRGFENAVSPDLPPLDTMRGATGLSYLIAPIPYIERVAGTVGKQYTHAVIGAARHENALKSKVMGLLRAYWEAIPRGERHLYPDMAEGKTRGSDAAMLAVQAIRQIEDSLLNVVNWQRVNRLGKDPILPRRDYYPHIATEFKDFYESLSPEHPMRQVFNRFLLRRNAEIEYDKDAARVIETHALTLIRSIVWDPIIEDLLPQVERSGRAHPSMLEYMRELTEHMAGRDGKFVAKLRRTAKSFSEVTFGLTGEKAEAFQRATERVFRAGHLYGHFHFLWGNASVPLANLTQQAFSFFDLNPKEALEGILVSLSPKGRKVGDIIERVARRLGREDFELPGPAPGEILGRVGAFQERLTNLREAHVAMQPIGSALAGANQLGMLGMTVSEAINRSWPAIAAYLKHERIGKARGLTGEALEEFAANESFRVVDRGQFMFGKVGTPQFLWGVHAKSILLYTRFPIQGAHAAYRGLVADPAAELFKPQVLRRNLRSWAEAEVNRKVRQDRLDPGHAKDEVERLVEAKWEEFQKHPEYAKRNLSRLMRPVLAGGFFYMIAKTIESVTGLSMEKGVEGIPLPGLNAALAEEAGDILRGYLETGDGEKALQQLQPIVKQRLDLALDLVDRGYLTDMAGRPVLDMEGKLIKADAHELVAALVGRRTVETKEALDWWREVIKDDKKVRHMRTKLVRRYYRAVEGEKEDAIREAALAIRERPDLFDPANLEEDIKRALVAEARTQQEPKDPRLKASQFRRPLGSMEDIDLQLEEVSEDALRLATGWARYYSTLWEGGGAGELAEIVGKYRLPLKGGADRIRSDIRNELKRGFREEFEKRRRAALREELQAR